MPGMDISRSLFVMVLIMITIAVAVLLNGGGSLPVSGTGTLTGNVSIGPLCPVEPCSVSYNQASAAYAARPITITTSGGNVVASLIADPYSGYSIALRPGTYIVDSVHQGIGGSRNLPKTVTIRAGETVWLNISIDTGIR